MSLAVLCTGAPPPTLAAAVAWYRATSAGRAAIAVHALAVAAPPDGWPRFAAAGGKGPAPDNSQALVAALVAALPPGSRSRLGTEVLVVVPPGIGFAPHTWRLRGGGAHLGGRRWLRRYAIVPGDAAVGAFAHELGHLLFGWPDLPRRVGADCLMALGGHRSDPPPPCAPLRVAAGWVTAAPVTAATRVDDLPAGAVAGWTDLLIERRDDALLVFRSRPVRLLRRVRVEAGDGARPLLALVAPPTGRVS